MNELPAHELGVILLSSSFLVALIVGGIAGKPCGLLVGAGVGALAISAMALSAAWMTWRAGDEPDRGLVRIEGSVSIDPEKANDWRQSGEAPTNHDLVIGYTDAQGVKRQLSGAYSSVPLKPGETVKLDYRPGQTDPPRVADPNHHRQVLMVFLLFGIVPLAMGATMLAAAWEDRARYRPSPRPSGVLKACGWGRMLANLVLLGGVAVSLWDSSLTALGSGFPLIGAGALLHAVLGAVAGLRPSMVGTFLVIAVGFIGFGWFAQLAA